MTSYQKFRQIQEEFTLQEDKDADLVIRQRLCEVKAMVKPRPELWQVWELMDTKQKELIMKAQETPTEQLKRDRRKKWKTIDVLRNAARMTYLLVSAFSTRKAYAEPDETPVAPVAMRRQPVLDNEGDQPEPVTKSTKHPSTKTSLGFDTQLAMSIAPQLRNTKDIDLILWVLRATKAFCHLFPAEMETELATVVAYEKYDDGRIIARQGRSPDRFYYIMTGKVHLIQDFVLDAGTIHKPMGFLTKGMTTDPNELDNAWLRDVNMVAKGQVEVLLIEKSDFARLQHTTTGPPVEFLRNLELFHEFPCEIFRDCGDALEVKYYSENRIVVEDSNRTPWLHVVKSGCVKVVREQNVRDTSADKLFSGRSVEELGCVRPFSHADAMLGILAKQRKLKNETKNNVEITSTSEQNGPSYETLEDGEAEDGVPEMRRIPMPGSAAPGSDTSLKTRTLPGVSRRVSLINIPIQPEPLAVSSRKAPDVRSTDKPQKPETQRKAFLQLDSLKTGDVFGLSSVAGVLRGRQEGLEHMHNPLASEGPGVVLVSDGAEVIRISKRFFLQHAPNNTMLKIETMQREYMSEDEAMEQLYNTEAWYRYKSALMSRTVRSLIRP